MGGRSSRRQQGGLQGYGDPYDPYYGLGDYGGSYDPYGPGTGGFGSGYITTSVNPGRIPYGFGGGSPAGLAPKVRVIFIPQGGAG